MALGVALRYVMEALQKPHGSKMYYFGIVALDRFRSRLKEYPRYCQHLMAIQHFNEFPPHLIEVLFVFFSYLKHYDDVGFYDCLDKFFGYYFQYLYF